MPLDVLHTSLKRRNCSFNGGHYEEGRHVCLCFATLWGPRNWWFMIDCVFNFDFFELQNLRISEHQNFRISESQNFTTSEFDFSKSEILNFYDKNTNHNYSTPSNFQASERRKISILYFIVSEFQNFRISEFQNFRISEFQTNLRVSESQNLRNHKISKFQICNANSVLQYTLISQPMPLFPILAGYCEGFLAKYSIFGPII
ncbi:Protein CBG19493 [Caenorhabditis briggsae]|uniref:Protein CBG19493 n=1 Tax=Caenorhabditis briggsae TaxID=6238 RepID=A8XVR1_CAEBR|nr:Protein CBG19493 [Caenorhabditis briggsae]CAP36730.1 Protein CBG19493 [Caenorhabditis briggsae]